MNLYVGSAEAEIGPLEKVDWAGNHLVRFTAALNAWRRDFPDSERVSREVQEASGMAVYRFTKPAVPPLELAHLVADTAHNLRSALDQVIWSLSDVTTLSEGQRRGIGFPIQAREDTSSFNRAMCGISDESVRGLVLSAQPFRSPYEFQRNPLWLLHEIDRHDKHRRTRVIHGFMAVPDVVDSIAPSLGNYGDVLAAVPLGSPPDLILQRELRVQVVVQVGEGND